MALEHVGAGCNRVVGCLDWSECGLIAYGAHRAVVIYDPEVTLIESHCLKDFSKCSKNLSAHFTIFFPLFTVWQGDCHRYRSR